MGNGCLRDRELCDQRFASHFWFASDPLQDRESLWIGQRSRDSLHLCIAEGVFVHTHTYQSISFGYAAQSITPKQFLQQLMSTDQTDDSPDSVFWTAIGVELGLGVIAVGLGWLTGVDVRQWIPMIELGQTADIWGGLAIGAAAAIPMLIGIELLERVEWEPIRNLKTFEELPVVSTLLSLSAAELVAIALAAGVGEELLVRGWLMAWICGPLASATPLAIGLGLVASSVAFGLMHPFSKTYVVLTSIIGLYLGALVLWTGNLLVPIAAHTVYDAVHMLLAKRQRQRELQQR